MTDNKSMKARPLVQCLVACLLVGLLTKPSIAQDVFFEGSEHDLRFFEPTHLDFDCRPIRKDCGYFFRYDKLSWAIVGETTTVGDNSVIVDSEVMYPSNPPEVDPEGEQGAPPAPYQIINGLQEVPPDAQFGWGDRYEFGNFNKGSGWTVGILDGPEVSKQTVFGFGPSLNGFGSVHVNFTTSPGFTLGWRDYQIQTTNEESEEGLAAGVVILGPGGPITSDGIADTSDGIAESDGIADDVDGDGIAAFFVIAFDLDGNGEIDDNEVIGNGVDFGDLHLFNIRFDTLLVRNSTELQGIEIMKTHVLDNQHKMVKRQNNHWEIGYGVRFLRLRDRFFLQGEGDVLGLTQVDTKTENQIVGPQIRSRWSSQRGRLNVALDTRFVFGYNVQDLDQQGDVGQNLVPGGLNSFLYGQPTTFSYGTQANDFSPLFELRADASYQLTSSIALNLGYTAMYIDSITRASQVVQYSLPNMGILPAGNQDVFINGANFGFDVVY